MFSQYRAQVFQPWFPLVPIEVKRGKKKAIVYQARPDDLGRKYQIGTVKVGQIFYIQDDHRPLGGTMRALQHRARRDCCRNPWMVVAWMNREYHPGVKHRPHTTYMLGGHIAMVRSLRDGRTKAVADWVLLQCVEAGLEKE